MNSVPLTQAVTSGDAGAVKALLANGADANERTGGGQTPLILATIFGHTHLIPLLLDAGADPQLRDRLGLNAIDWAQRRGATEAIEVLNNSRRGNNQTRPEIRSPTPPPRSTAPVESGLNKPAPVSEAERSRRWIEGLKQRIAEQSQRDVPDGPNIFRPRPAPPDSEPQLANTEAQPQLSSVAREPEPEIPVEPLKPQPEIPATPTEPKPEIPAPPPDPTPDLPAQPAPTEPTPESPGESLPPAVQAAAGTPRRSTRKRCPKCNAIYNSELVAYCAHHIVALVDDDEPAIISQPHSTTTSPVLFWMIIIITLTGSVVIGSIVAGFFYTAKQPEQPAVTASQPAPNTVQKGTPVVDKELEGKVVSLPIAECPLNGQEAIPGTVVVRVAVDKTGQVKEAQASGGDWLLRGAATEAAKKSTFAPEKLHGRDTEGAITYTFEP